MDDRILVEVVHGSHDAILEFLFGGDTDVANDGSGKLGKNALHEVEPGAMFWRESKFETADGLTGEPGSGLLGDVGGMIVEDQLDCRMGLIGGIEKLEEFDELAAAMAILDQGVNLAGEQIDAGQQADRAVALVFMIAREGRMGAGSGGKSGAVVAIAWMPGFSSYEMIATASLGFCLAAAAVSLMIFTSR